MTAEADRSAPAPSANSILAQNLAALWATDARLAEIVDAIDDDREYPVEPSRSGEPTLALPAPAGKPIYLHSRHQPIQEAVRLIDSIAVRQAMTFHVLGLGLGYHLQELFDRASDEAIFCVFEPDPRMIRTAFRHRDFSRLIVSRRILWVHRSDKADLVARLTPHSAQMFLGTRTIAHGPSQQLHEKFFRQARVWIDEIAAFCRTSMNTVVLNSLTTARNIALNIGWYAAAPGLERLKDRHAGRPAVIVSAGPSLRKNKHLLAGLESRAIVIAVQTTLQPLLEMGVRPHFVTSIDYHEICQRFFERLPPDLTTELIAEPKTASGILRMMTGPVTVIGDKFAESLVRELDLRKTPLTSSATVAHLAFYLAEHMGCDPIIFVGQDLAFSDGLCYTPGTSYEDVWRPELSRFCTVEMKQWEQIVRERPILRRIPDIQGRPIYTEERLFAYLQQFERDFAKSRRRIIDATEGGALKRGAEPMPLAQAIERFCQREWSDIAGDRPAMRWDRLSAARQSVLNRRAEAEQIRQIAAQALPVLEEIRDKIEDQVRVNRLIGRMDDLRRKMDALGRTYDQVMQFTQTTELRRFQADRKLAAEKTQGAERQRRQVERDIENARAVVDACAVFMQTMLDVAAELDRLGEEQGKSITRKEAA